MITPYLALLALPLWLALTLLAIPRQARDRSASIRSSLDLLTSAGLKVATYPAGPGHYQLLVLDDDLVLMDITLPLPKGPWQIHCAPLPHNAASPLARACTDLF